MSFQGDVAGIGLGELLQGLARGGRDGVLTLYGEKVSGALGLKGGMLYLLAGPDEDEEVWRERSQRAWAADPKPLMETKRREAIARAERLETFYRMLETSNLHFRFEPGPLPAPRQAAKRSEGEAASDEPWGQGMPVEYMLLEHARLTDEGEETGVVIEDFDIPRALDVSRFEPDVRDFLEECEGHSTLQEIADRLGWPLRQCRSNVHEHYTQGVIRLAQPRELLAAAQKELELGRVGRAATRLTGWVRASPPGPPPVGDAELLVGEWDSGRLSHVLPTLSAPNARAILRKLDRVHLDPRASVERWSQLVEAHRADELTVLHATALRLVVADEPDARSFSELLRLARNFQERGLATRTRTLLRLAGRQLPAKPQVRVELGRRMLETGLIEEGTRWLLDVARELVDLGDGERATTPIRAVLKKLPDHSEAHGLLIEARALVARKRRRRWKSVVALSVILMLSLVGLVHFKVRHTHATRMEEIKENLNRPDVALSLMTKYFPTDDSERVSSLRSTVLALKKEADDTKRVEWMDRYEAIEQECEFGDPLLGLKRSLELPKPPHVGGGKKWPERVDLLNVLTLRIEKRRNELDVSVHASVEDLHAEERLQTLLQQLMGLSEDYDNDDDVESFFFRLNEVHRAITERREQRAVLRAQLANKELEKEQDMLLGAARAHYAAGDLERAVSTYQRLTETDSFEELRDLVEVEIQEARDHWRAFRTAVEQAEAGDHAAALLTLEEGCPNDPSEHLLPWQVTSIPTGARAFFPDGQTRVTPFVAKTAPGEELELRFEHDGFEPLSHTIKDPANLEVHMHRTAERAFATSKRVEALPVPVGDDHILADRSGRILRLGGDSQPRWSARLNTLGGIGRTPVFMPHKPGHLLVVSEDGQAWLVDASNGSSQGPLDLGSPPVDGPTLTRRGIWALFEGERFAVWEDSLTPRFYDKDSSFLNGGERGLESAVPATMAALRRHASEGSSLTSPWTYWTVEIREDEYFAQGPDGKGFTAARHGEWSFAAWEAPKALMPMGRLWVSDENGLRCYSPHEGLLLRYPGH